MADSAEEELRRALTRSSGLRPPGVTLPTASSAEGELLDRVSRGPGYKTSSAEEELLGFLRRPSGIKRATGSEQEVLGGEPSPLVPLLGRLAQSEGAMLGLSALNVGEAAAVRLWGKTFFKWLMPEVDFSDAIWFSDLVEKAFPDTSGDPPGPLAYGIDKAFSRPEDPMTKLLMESGTESKRHAVGRVFFNKRTMLGLALGVWFDPVSWLGTMPSKLSKVGQVAYAKVLRQALAEFGTSLEEIGAAASKVAGRSISNVPDIVKILKKSGKDIDSAIEILGTEGGENTVKQTKLLWEAIDRAEKSTRILKDPVALAIQFPGTNINIFNIPGSSGLATWYDKALTALPRYFGPRITNEFRVLFNPDRFAAFRANPATRAAAEAIDVVKKKGSLDLEELGVLRENLKGLLSEAEGEELDKLFRVLLNPSNLESRIIEEGRPTAVRFSGNIIEALDKGARRARKQSLEPSDWGTTTEELGKLLDQGGELSEEAEKALLRQRTGPNIGLEEAEGTAAEIMMPPLPAQHGGQKTVAGELSREIGEEAAQGYRLVTEGLDRSQSLVDQIRHATLELPNSVLYRLGATPAEVQLYNLIRGSAEGLPPITSLEALRKRIPDADELLVSFKDKTKLDLSEFLTVESREIPGSYGAVKTPGTKTRTEAASRATRSFRVSKASISSAIERNLPGAGATTEVVFDNILESRASRALESISKTRARVQKRSEIFRNWSKNNPGAILGLNLEGAPHIPGAKTVFKGSSETANDLSLLKILERKLNSLFGLPPEEQIQRQVTSISQSWIKKSGPGMDYFAAVRAGDMEKAGSIKIKIEELETRARAEVLAKYQKKNAYSVSGLQDAHAEMSKIWPLLSPRTKKALQESGFPFREVFDPVKGENVLDSGIILGRFTPGTVDPATGKLTRSRFSLGSQTGRGSVAEPRTIETFMEELAHESTRYFTQDVATGKYEVHVAEVWKAFREAFGPSYSRYSDLQELMTKLPMEAGTEPLEEAFAKTFSGLLANVSSHRNLLQRLGNENARFQFVIRDMDNWMKTKGINEATKQNLFADFIRPGLDPVISAPTVVFEKKKTQDLYDLIQVMFGKVWDQTDQLGFLDLPAWEKLQAHRKMFGPATSPIPLFPIDPETGKLLYRPKDLYGSILDVARGKPAFVASLEDLPNFNTDLRGYLTQLDEMLYNSIRETKTRAEVSGVLEGIVNNPDVSRKIPELDALTNEPRIIRSSKYSAAKGESSVSISYKDASDGWVQMPGIKALAGMEVHPDVAQMLKMRLSDKGPLKALRNYKDWIQGPVKIFALTGAPGLALTWPIKNVVNNFWKLWLGGIDPIDHWLGLKMQLDIPGVVEIAPGVRIPLSTAKRMADSLGVYKGVGLFSSEKANWATKVPGAQQTFWLSGKAEDWARSTAFVHGLRNQMNPVQSYDLVTKLLFQYSGPGSKTKFERDVMSTAFPFYSWPRKNIPAEIRLFTEQPGKYVAASKVYREVSEAEDKKLGMPPRPKLLPDWVAKNWPLQMVNPTTGKSEYFIMDSWLPTADFLKILKPLELSVSMFDPVIKELFLQTVSLPGFSPEIRDPATGERVVMYEYTRRYPTESELKPGGKPGLPNWVGQSVNMVGMNMPNRVARVLKIIRFAKMMDQINPWNVWGTQKKPGIFGQTKPGYDPAKMPTSRKIQTWLFQKGFEYDEGAALRGRVGRLEAELRDAEGYLGYFAQKESKQNMEDLISYIQMKVNDLAWDLRGGPEELRREFRQMLKDTTTGTPMATFDKQLEDDAAYEEDLNELLSDPEETGRTPEDELLKALGGGP